LSEPADLLRIEGLAAKHGETQVLWDVDLRVRSGEVVALVGANGAGKSTLMNTVSGLLKAAAGSIRFGGDELVGHRPQDIVRAGISQVPEGRQVFGNLDVEENLLIGAYTTRDPATVARRLESVYELFPRLRERTHQAAGTMSGGEQQMLAIGRGLMSGPRLLLLDEPSLGLAPVIVSEVFRGLRQIVKSGTTLLLVEQNSRIALRFADRAYVLETGRIVLGGDADDLARDPRVRQLYLGQGMQDRSAEPVVTNDGAQGARRGEGS
jgi:branched-chain amino acid transport system ATP-binding protein